MFFRFPQSWFHCIQIIFLVYYSILVHSQRNLNPGRDTKLGSPMPIMPPSPPMQCWSREQPGKKNRGCVVGSTLHGGWGEGCPRRALIPRPKDPWANILGDTMKRGLDSGVKHCVEVCVRRPLDGLVAFSRKLVEMFECCFVTQREICNEYLRCAEAKIVVFNRGGGCRKLVCELLCGNSFRYSHIYIIYTHCHH